MKKILYLFFILSSVYAKERIRYDGYKVYRITPENDNQRNILIDLENNNDYYFWTDARNVIKPVDILVKPKLQDTFEILLNTNGMTPKILIDDVQSRIESEVVGRLNKNVTMSWDKYYPLDDINDWLYYFRTLYPGKTNVIIAGISGESRNILGFLVDLSPGISKPLIVIEGGIHANEWISPATVTYVINELLTTTDPAFKRIAESFEWQLYPSVNPDGYVYTHETDRMWRKTRSVNETLPCVGADPNRNWNIHWMELGASDDSCSNNYAGYRPFSEREMTWFSNLLRSLKNQMVAYLSLHSYGQMLLLPFGNTTEHLDNYNEMIQIGKKCTEALSKRYGTEYVVGNIPEILYPATGSSVDWVKEKLEMNISVAYELRDKGQYGFLLPANQIIPNAEEFVDSLVGLFEEAEKFGYVTLKPKEDYF